MSLLLSVATLVLSLLFRGLGGGDRYYEGFTEGGIVVGGVWLITWAVDRMKLSFTEILIAAVAIFWLWTNAGSPPIPLPLPQSPSKKPLLPWRSAEAFTESDTSPAGAEPVTDLPKPYRKANISSKGLGCCVFRSIDHAAHYQNIPALYGMPEWMVSKGIPGGGYPEKVDKLVPQMLADKKGSVDYVQHTGGDEKFLELALKTGRMVCVTYAGNDNRYRSGIDHMVNLVYLDDKEACILDNNFIDKYLWMSRDEFLKRWRDRGGGWAIVFVNEPAPQPPFN